MSRYSQDDQGNISIIAGNPSLLIDTALSGTSTNAVQNKVITNALNDKADATDVDKAYKYDDTTDTSISDDDYIPFYDTSAQAMKKIAKSNLGGGGSGDMTKAVYDSDSSVENAGGIADYVDSVLPDVSTKMDKTNPTGTGSFSLNRKANTTVGSYSFAEGETTTSSGEASHAEGLNTIAGYNYQHVGGKYNSNKSTTLFEVGNGTGDSARSNAFEVYSDGSLSTDNGTTKVKLEDLTAADKSIYEVMGENGAKNLLPIKYSKITNYGLTWEKSNDGYIILNGTSTASPAQQSLFDDTPKTVTSSTGTKISLKDLGIDGTKTYVFSRDTKISNVRPRIDLYSDSAKLLEVELSNNDGLYKEIDFSQYPTCTGIKATIQVTLNTAVTNAIQKIMLCSKEWYDVDPTFQPYTKTNQQLTSKTDGLWDNMMERGSVNLLDSAISTQVANDITVTNNGDGTYTVNCTSTSHNSTNFFGAKKVKLSKGTYKWTASEDGNSAIGSNNCYAFIRGVNGTVDWYRSYQYSYGYGIITLTQDSEIELGITVAANVAVSNLTFYPMITRTFYYGDYIPYTMSNRELTDSAYKSKASRFCLRIDGDSGAWMDDYTRSFIGVTKTTTLQQLVQKFASADVRSVNLSIALNSASFTTSSAQVLQDVATLLGIMDASTGIGVIEIQCIDVALGRLQVKFINVSNGYIKMCQTNNWTLSGSVRTLPISYGQGLHITNNSLEADIHHLSVDTYSSSVAGNGSGYQYISINGTNKPITGTMYLEAGRYISSGSEIYFEFSDSVITSSAVFDVYCDVPLVSPTQMVQSGTNMKVYFSASDNVTKCRLYIKA